MINLLEIAAPTLEWFQLAPLLIVFIGAAVGIVAEAVVPRSVRYLAGCFIAGITVLIALGFVVMNGIEFEAGRLIGMGIIAFDGPTLLFWGLLLLVGLGGVAVFAERGVGDGTSAFAASAATVPGSPLEREAVKLKREHTEVFPLLLFSLLGMMVFAAANDLITMFVSLEVFSLPLYLLSAMGRRRRLLSQEAALKYFLLGSLASAFFVYGVALMYGFSGGFKLVDIVDAIDRGTGSNVLLLTGLVMLAVGLLFKIGAVPFHTWVPDVYTGAPTPVTGYMAVATKTAAIAALLRVFFVGLGGARWDWQPLFAVVAVITMLVGATIGLLQTDVKRLLAYSSVVHAGFLLVAVTGAVAGADLGVTSVSAIVFYLLTYGLATLGAFAIVTMVRRSGGEANNLDAWRGLGKSNPFVAAIMTLFLLSLAGIPPTAGFIGKLTVFQAAAAGGFGWLVFAAVVCSVVAAFFYLKVVVVMWFREPDPELAATVAVPSLWTWTLVIVGAAATLVLGLVPGGVLDLLAGMSQFVR
ncbi:NADH-quinone oxidoreductase subunit NuoN [Tessaracoccus caeni]|uniref:NADH-quinone oxidoreductase subunit NuoN n=1 Tax=Tessaracoccus caeni TaxID=3031239 RepID=UPI0023D99B6A|nr:NADH-quinone oxidoreductase subunit NuoN [Tessaracoccus caeni]MDF1487048.1 NADH-quinone oxidoreductase subunit NuoN [Tessaracoccus caeni]